ncbi:MAG: DUF1450 domain-containing protein [Hydrogenibacillus sp.]|nr:DUF1450 domain-containing protein [Hydrogenibacillus sp.]
MARFVSLCQNNAATEVVAAVEEMARRAGLNVIVAKCQNRCAFCDDVPYALIGREVVFGDDLEEFLEELGDALAARSTAGTKA